MSGPLAKKTVSMGRDDILRLQVAGAGGWGDPLSRDAEMVRKDVLNGKVSLNRAREAYGVVLDADTLQVDEAATKAHRAGM